MENNYYKLTTESVAIVQKHNEETGELQAHVLENGEYYPVKLSAPKLIEWNLSLVGFSMKGCKETARLLLETTTMFPVCLNYEMLIYFPTESIKNDIHAWIALHMVRDIIELTPTTSKVLCYGPTDLIIPVPHNTLRQRWNKALLLKAKLMLARKPRIFCYGKRRQELMIVCEGVRVGYKIRK